MDSIRRKIRPNFSMKETARTIREMNGYIKNSNTDTTLIFLLRQHSRTHFTALAFIRALEDELSGFSRVNESLQAIILNALDYVKKNIKTFSEIIDQQIKNHKSSKKDLNSDPFGVSGPVSSRNGANKENYGGNSNTTK